MKISIIIPVYNGENTIKECLESVSDQTFKDYEIIVVNSSNDNTQDISYAESLKIGGRPFTNEFFNGVIDEIKIYNRALNASEINSEYNSASTSNKKSLFSYFSLLQKYLLNLIPDS